MKKIICDKCKVELRSKYVELLELDTRIIDPTYDSYPRYDLCVNCFQLVQNFILEERNADNEIQANRVYDGGETDKR